MLVGIVSKLESLVANYIAGFQFGTLEGPAYVVCGVIFSELVLAQCVVSCSLNLTQP